MFGQKVFAALDHNNSVQNRVTSYGSNSCHYISFRLYDMHHLDLLPHIHQSAPVTTLWSFDLIIITGVPAQSENIVPW